MSAPNPLPPGSYRSNFAFPSGTYLLGDAFALTPPGAPWQGRPWRLLDLAAAGLPWSDVRKAGDSLRALKVSPALWNVRRLALIPLNEVPR